MKNTVRALLAAMTIVVLGSSCATYQKPEDENYERTYYKRYPRYGNGYQCH